MKRSYGLSVATYNLMLSTRSPIRFNGQAARLDRLPAAISELKANGKCIDVVVVQELIPPAFTAQFQKAMHRRGWKYCTKPLTTPLSKQSVRSPKLADGGVFIFSRYPIVKEDQASFSLNCIDADCLAAKGVVYCCIDTGSMCAHIFGTHFQAWPEPEYSKVRVTQSRLCSSLMTRLNIPATEPVLFCGDLNIDTYTQPSHLAEVAEVLSVQMCELADTSAKFSVDPTTNTLVGNDDGSKYQTMQYPQGCYSEYLKTNLCTCCPAELLDYIGFSVHHQRPRFYSHWVQPVKADRVFVTNRTLLTRKPTRDLSDHYPVVAVFTFDQPDHYVRVQPHDTSTRWTRSTYRSNALVCTFLVVALALLLFTCKRVRSAPPPAQGV